MLELLSSPYTSFKSGKKHERLSTYRILRENGQTNSIGKIKEIRIDPENWKVTHLEVELTKDVAESCLAQRKVECETCWTLQP